MQLRVRGSSVFAPGVVRLLLAIDYSMGLTQQASKLLGGLLCGSHAVVYKADRDETERLAFRGLVAEGNK